MKALILALQIFVVVAPPPPPKEEAARILAQAPGLSNRTGWTPLVLEPRGPVSAPETSATRSANPAPAAETAQGRANRMGIPGGWTPLEWAILHSSGPSSGGRK